MERTLQQILNDGDDDEICCRYEDWDYISSRRLPGSVARLELAVGDDERHGRGCAGYRRVRG